MRPDPSDEAKPVDLLAFSQEWLHGRWRSSKAASHSAGSVEAVARRVLELLDGTEAEGLIDAVEVARRRGCSPAWVYRHKDELGVIRQGDGPRPRLRFDPEVACSAGKRSLSEQSSAQAEKPRGRPRSRPGTDVPLLPIRGRQEAS